MAVKRLQSLNRGELVYISPSGSTQKQGYGTKPGSPRIPRWWSRNVVSTSTRLRFCLKAMRCATRASGSCCAIRMVPRGRVELPTPAFSGPRSTGELPRHRHNKRFYGKGGVLEREKRLVRSVRETKRRRNWQSENRMCSTQFGRAESLGKRDLWRGTLRRTKDDIPFRIVTSSSRRTPSSSLSF